MPKVLEKDGFVVRIRTNDHLPSHVHVFKSGGEAEAKINLGNETERPSFVKIWRMSDKDAFRALKLVIANQAELIEKWREIHGEPDSE